VEWYAKFPEQSYFNVSSPKGASFSMAVHLPGFSRSGYHVLLATPTVPPTVTVRVPSKAAGQAFKLKDGKFIGVLDPGFFDPIIDRWVESYTPNQLPIFQTDNVFEAPGAVLKNC
jgi:hypothetical protein